MDHEPWAQAKAYAFRKREKKEENNIKDTSSNFILYYVEV